MELEKRLEVILSKIKGVSNVSVLITYSETEEVVPLYNINNSSNQTEEGDGKEKVIRTAGTVGIACWYLTQWCYWAGSLIALGMR